MTRPDLDEDDEFQETPELQHFTYEELEEKLTKAEQLAQENWNKAATAQAELENFKRRTEKEISQTHKYAVEKLLLDLIPVVDSLEKSLEVKVNDETSKKIHHGIELTLQMFLQALKKYGVTIIEPKDGEPFNPVYQEAMCMEEDPDYPANTIIKVLQKGYQLHERLIRPARVIVSKG